MTHPCPVCLKTQTTEPFRDVDGFPYFSCKACDSIFIEPQVLADMDRGVSPRDYDLDYWNEELKAARERASGDGLVRAGEAVLYARREVRRFLDLGAGPGYLLDQLAATFPAHSDLFHAVELFPPEEHSTHKNYVVGDVGSLSGKFDAGVCIEVVEHLTPRMLGKLAEGLAAVAAPDSTWLFNTGLPHYVRQEDPGYLDPRKRGHIVSYGITGLRHIFEPFGFCITPLPGKSFAFLAEFQPTQGQQQFTSDRFYAPVEANVRLLRESALLYIAAFESARSYYFQDESLSRVAMRRSWRRVPLSWRKLYRRLLWT
jgi:hypothetical protein